MDFKTYVVTMLGAAAVLTGIFLLTDSGADKDSAPFAAFLKGGKKDYAPFAAFLKEHGKDYASPMDLEYRLGVFTANAAFIARARAGPRTFEMGVNKFADLSWEEFASFYLMRPVANPSAADGPPEPPAPAGKKDWAKEGKVGPVRNQGACGSCWAFAAIGAMQAAVAISNGAREEYSVQELVDCAEEYENNGCEGGLPANAYKYIIDKKVALAADYPYVGRMQDCAVNAEKTRKGLAAYESLAQISVQGLINLLLRSPVAIGIEVQHDFMFYKSGVYTGSAGCGKHVNHAVLLTAYDAPNKAFTIQNSWGGDWGEAGFVRVAFGTKKTGTCGMVNAFDTIPLVQVSV